LTPYNGLENRLVGSQKSSQGQLNQSVAENSSPLETPMLSDATLAQPTDLDPDLAELVAAWGSLPADVRKMILGVVRLTPRAETK
jgi:hypothetical protein